VKRDSTSRNQSVRRLPNLYARESRQYCSGRLQTAPTIQPIYVFELLGKMVLSVLKVLVGKRTKIVFGERRAGYAHAAAGRDLNLL
jgi:hypothetical protein